MNISVNKMCECAQDHLLVCSAQGKVLHEEEGDLQQEFKGFMLPEGANEICCDPAQTWDNTPCRACRCTAITIGDMM